MTDQPSGPVPLSLIEQRILGVLIEKQKTTPDVYPMTLNGLTVGCNQKSNRDPVLNLVDEEIESTLEGLHSRQLVIRVAGGRTDKWKHVLYEMWNVDKVEIAVLAELFLRGPQSEGELRTRVNRMEPIDDIDTLRSIVQRLDEREFTIYLTPEGRRGTVIGHRFLSAEELANQKSRASAGSRLDDASARARPASIAGNEIAELRKELMELRLTVAALEEQMRQMQAPPGTN